MQDPTVQSNERERSGMPLAWAGILLCAVAAHLPALRGYFLQDDWPHLARAMGRLAEPESLARPLSRLLGFRLGLTFFGFEAAAWHALALIAWGCACWLIFRLGRRFGLGELGAGFAALVAAGSPLVITPIFWASASAEIFAVLFGLAALEAWTREGRSTGIVALAWALLSVFTKESLLALPLLLALHAWAMGPVTGRGRWQALLVGLGTSLGALCAAALVWKGMAGNTPLDPYALGGPRLQLMNLGVLGAWLISPWRFLPVSSPGLPWLGLLVWIGWAGFGIFRARRGDRRVLWWCAWGILALAPVLPLQRHLQPYYLLAALPAFAWTLGQLLESLWPSPARNPRQVVYLLVIFGMVATGLGFTATRSRLEARGDRGGLLDPLAKRSAIAYETHRIVRTLPLEAGQTLAVLAATYTEWPEEIPADLAQRMNSQVYAAIMGPVGLGAMARPEIELSWDSHLDDLSPDALVLFDDGGPRLRYWGRAHNARLYSALIAVAAGQYQRARHDLWVVSGERTETEFIFDEGLFPIPPETLDDTGPEFVRFVLRTEADDITARRIVLLFSQMYRAVRARPLEY